jgi:hypothetical protein
MSAEPIAGYYAGDYAGHHRTERPSTCRQARHCDVLALEVVPPENVAPDELYVLRVELIYPIDRTHTVTGIDQDETDLDIYLWDSDDAERPVAAGTAFGLPEIMYYSPTKRETLWLVVVNVLGRNDTYDLVIQGTHFEAEEPFDASKLSPSRPPTPGASSVDGDSADVVAGSGGSMPQFGAVLGPGVGIAPFLSDPDFGSPLDTRSAVEVAVEEASRVARRALPPKPVPRDPSAAELLAWLLLVPIALVFGERALFRHRPLPSGHVLPQ